MKLDNVQKVLKLFFEEPQRGFHIRLLARLTKLNPNTIIKITESLAKKQILIKNKSKDNNLVITKANTGCEEYKLEKKLYNIRKIFDSGLIEFLNSELHYPWIMLFGSYARGENDKRSDIDLFVVCDKKKRLDLHIYEEKLAAEIQIFMHTKREFNLLKKNSPELINNVLNGSKLSGFLDVC